LGEIVHSQWRWIHQINVGIQGTLGTEVQYMGDVFFFSIFIHQLK